LLTALGFEQQTRGFAAAGHRHLAACVAQSLVDRVHREAEAARDRFGVVTADDQAQGLLFLLGQGAKALFHRHGHISPT